MLKPTFSARENAATHCLIVIQALWANGMMSMQLGDWAAASGYYLEASRVANGLSRYLDKAN